MSLNDRCGYCDHQRGWHDPECHSWCGCLEFERKIAHIARDLDAEIYELMEWVNFEIEKNRAAIRR